MDDITLNNGVKMPMAGLGTFLLSPDEAQESVYAALKEGLCCIHLIPPRN